MTTLKLTALMQACQSGDADEVKALLATSNVMNFY